MSWEIFNLLQLCLYNLTFPEHIEEYSWLSQEWIYHIILRSFKDNKTNKYIENGIKECILKHR